MCWRAAVYMQNRAKLSLQQTLISMIILLQPSLRSVDSTRLLIYFWPYIWNMPKCAHTSQKESNVYAHNPNINACGGDLVIDRCGLQIDLIAVYEEG